MAIAGLLFAALVLGGWFHRGFFLPDPATYEVGRTVAATYDPPDQVVELYFNQGDGQLFAHQAQDPFLQHPGAIRGGAQEEAYRLQRPLYGWVGWVASGGRPDAVAWALIAVTILSVALLAAVAALASRSRGRSPLWGLAILAAPGVAADLLRCGPEVLGAALVGAGILAWTRRERRSWLAVGCFALACLARETLVLVPLTLAAVDWWSSRPPGATWEGAARRARTPLVASVVPYLAWVLLLRVGLGAWPRGNVDGRLSMVPFGGLASALPHMDGEELLALALVLLPALAALLKGRDVRLRALVAAHLLLAALLGEAVWVSWLDFSRVLLPLSLVALLALVTRPAPTVGEGSGAAVANRAAGSTRPEPDPHRSPEDLHVQAPGG